MGLSLIFMQKKTNGTYTIGQVCYEFQVSPKNLHFKYYRKLEEVYSEYVIDIFFSYCNIVEGEATT
jgi:hypothetical protein